MPLLFYAPIFFFSDSFGIFFLIWNNIKPIYHSISEEKTLEKKASRGFTKKKANTLKKDRVSREIQKKIFNKKYPERKLLPEEEIAIVKGREITTWQSPPDIPEISEIQTGESVQKNNDKIEKFEFRQEGNIEKKIQYSVSGILYLDYSKKIPPQDKNMNEEEWEDSDFNHFRRIGSSTLVQSGERFEMGNEPNILSIHLDDIDRLIFYNRAFCILPTAADLPNLIFFTKELETIKNGVSQEYMKV